MARIYGRMNAIKTMSSPMQGPGQDAVHYLHRPQHRRASALGNNGVTPSTVFRIGPDGLMVPLPAVTQVLPEPYIPG